MENLFKELAWKCFQHDLGFEYMQHGSIYVWKHEDKETAKIVTDGSMTSEYETPLDTLTRMHQEVDEFIEVETMEDTEFSRPRGVSSDELKMKETGHKMSDFE